MSNKLINFIFIFSFLGCRNDSEIINLLKSSNHKDVILGAFKAGETGDKKFVPYLLSNANDPRASTTLRFKGFSVYQEKMGALEKIFKRQPPVRISRQPDSVVIKFFIVMAKENP